MINSNNLERANALIEGVNNAPQVKRVKKDLGLLERTENEKIILEEDNRQIIFG